MTSLTTASSGSLSEIKGLIIKLEVALTKMSSEPARNEVTTTQRELAPGEELWDFPDDLMDFPPMTPEPSNLALLHQFIDEAKWDEAGPSGSGIVEMRRRLPTSTSLSNVTLTSSTISVGIISPTSDKNFDAKESEPFSDLEAVLTTTNQLQLTTLKHRSNNIDNPTDRGRNSLAISITDQDLFGDSNEVDSVSEASTKSRDGVVNSACFGIGSTEHNTLYIDSGNEEKAVPSLITAVGKRDLAGTIKILESGHDLEARHPLSGKTAIIVSAMTGQYEILEALLRRNANTNSSDRDGRTALHYTASDGYIRCTQLLLSHGASAEIKDMFKELPLHRAARYGRANSVKILLHQHRDPLSQHVNLRRNALHLAAYHGHPQVVKVICEHIRSIDHSADCSIGVFGLPEDDGLPKRCHCSAKYPRIDDFDHNGRTAFNFAIFAGLSDVVSTLLQYSKSEIDTPLRVLHFPGPLPHTPEEEPQVRWRRPLHLAIASKNSTPAHIALLKTLLDNGADTSQTDSKGRTALNMATQLKNIDATKVLLCQSGDLNMEFEKHHKKPFLFEVIETLMLEEKTSRYDISTPDGFELLQIVRDRKQWRIIQRMIVECVQPDQVGKILDASKILDKAIRESAGDMVEFLVKTGASIAPNSHVDQPNAVDLIHIAAKQNDIRILNVLVQNGANVLSEDSASFNRSCLPIHHAIHAEKVDCTTIEWHYDTLLRCLKDLHLPSEEFDKRMEFIMRRGLKLACRSTSEDKLALLLRLSKEQTGQDFFGTHLLETSVSYGREKTTSFILSYGLDMFAKLGYPIIGDFCPLEETVNRPGNTLKDYGRCKKLVQEASAHHNEIEKRKSPPSPKDMFSKFRQRGPPPRLVKK